MASWTDDEISLLRDVFYDSTRRELDNAFPDRSIDSIRRKAYRLNLRRHDNIQRIKSVKEVNTLDTKYIDGAFGHFIAGFVAGEGTFTKSTRPTGTNRYRFAVALANDDSEILYDMKGEFGCGHINHYSARRKSEKPQVIYTINGYGELVNRVVPFFDEYWFRSARKGTQYDEWRSELLDEVPNSVLQNEVFSYV